MKLPIVDYRVPSLRQVKLEPTDMIILGADRIVTYTWGEAPPPWNSWQGGFYQHLSKIAHSPEWNPESPSALSVDSLSIRISDSELLISPWSDSYKWGRANTLYSPRLKHIAETIRNSDLDKVVKGISFGNWASGVIYEKISDSYDLKTLSTDDEYLTLYHGTNSAWADEIQEHGFKTGMHPRQKGNPLFDAVYFSGSQFRAQYFARASYRRYSAQAKTNKKKTGVEPVVLKVKIKASDYNLVADDDWIDVLKHEGVRDTTWQESLQELGQVGVMFPVSADVIESRVSVPPKP